MFKNVERFLFSWFLFPSILENLENVLENLPILPELFLLTATLVLLVYGFGHASYIKQSSFVLQNGLAQCNLPLILKFKFSTN